MTLEDHLAQPGFEGAKYVCSPPIRSKHDKHHMNMDHSSWEGFKVDGKVDTVLSRGKVVVEKDKFTGTKGHGKYIKRGLCQYLN